MLSILQSRCEIKIRYCHAVTLSLGHAGMSFLPFSSHLCISEVTKPAIFPKRAL